MKREAAPTEQNPVFRLEDYRPTPYAIPKTALAIDLEPQKTRIAAALEIVRRPETEAETPLILDGDGLHLISVCLNGMALGDNAYRAAPDRLEIFSPPAENFTLEIVTEINPDANRALMGLYRSNGVFCSQCEAEGFRRITYFYDRPDVLSVYTVRLAADKAACPVLLANGNRQAAGDLPNGRHFAVWHDPHPKPSYLFACVGGDLEAVSDCFTTKTGQKAALNIYVEHGKAARALYAMDSLKRAFAWDEEKFGRVYDLEVFNIVAVSDFNMGAMENKGLNIFNDKYVLADPQTATDSDYADIERVIAHEYFHNWTGNRITCRDWFQLCLKEGLTVYRDQEFSADMRARAVQRLKDIAFLTDAQFAEDAGPLAHPVRPRSYAEINNFYTVTVYEKGAELVRMLAAILGEAGFRAGMNLYFARHDGQAATIEDFIQCFADSSGRDFSQFMLWYAQAGTPQVKADYVYDENTGSLTLNFSQSVRPTKECAHKQPMMIPIRFGFVGADGKDMAFANADKAAQGNVLLLTESRQSFHFTGLAGRPVLSLLRGFSAPIRLELPLSPQERLFLAAHDSDIINRCLALRSLVIDSLTAAAGGKSVPGLDKAAVLSAPAQTAADERLEPAVRAFCLRLPSEAELAAAVGKNIDPDLVFAARRDFLRALAAKSQAEFAVLRQRHAAEAVFSPTAEEAGKRAFAHILTEYLAVAADSPALAAALYAEADNMTARLAGLSILTRHFPGSAAAEQALCDFSRRFAGNALALDKWFALQAGISGAAALDRVKKLTQHQAFSYDNPNRVRALIGSFAANQTGFHRADGAAYCFLAEIITQIDSRNPQLAARLLTAWRSWRQMEAGRRGKMQAALGSIAGQRSLSRDSRDIVSRLLAD